MFFQLKTGAALEAGRNADVESIEALLSGILDSGLRRTGSDGLIAMLSDIPLCKKNRQGCPADFISPAHRHLYSYLTQDCGLEVVVSGPKMNCVNLYVTAASAMKFLSAARTHTQTELSTATI